MSYRATKKVETYCDRCGRIKPELMPGGSRPWSLWITPNGHTWHHCPDCIVARFDKMTVEDLAP